MKRIKKYAIIFLIMVIGTIVTVTITNIIAYYSITMQFLIIFIVHSIVALLNEWRQRVRLSKLEHQIELHQIHEVMLEVSNSIFHMEDKSKLLQNILNKAVSVSPNASHGTILVKNEEGNLEFKALKGYKDSMLSIVLEPRETYQWQETSGDFRRPILIDDISKYNALKKTCTLESFEEAKGLHLKSALSTPILINGDFYGWINIDSTERKAFTEKDIQLMKYFASQVAIVIFNHLHYEHTLHLSRYDALTGIGNRRYFQEQFDKKVKENENTNEVSSFVVMDLNNLKIINDKYGHNTGDLYIQTFAQRFSDSIRDSDLFARYGGDEFAAVFYGMDNKQVEKKIQLIRDEIAKHPIIVDGNEIKVCFSFGVVQISDEFNVYQTLVSLADERMYEDKKKIKENMLNS